MMNKRTFLEAIVAAEVSDEVKAYAQEAIAKMDAVNEKRKAPEAKAKAAEKRQAENAPLIAAILGVVTNEVKTASAITAEVNATLPEEVKVQKVSALLRGLVNEGKVAAQDVKVPKKGTVKGYSLAE